MLNLYKILMFYSEVCGLFEVLKIHGFHRTGVLERDVS